MPVAVESSLLPEHPAVRGWLALHPDQPPDQLEIWTRGGEHKAAVFRLAFRDPGMPAVFAKRARAGSLAVEREVLERILPRLAVPAARFHGIHRDAGVDWLFSEDVGDRWLRPQRRAERRLAGDWLGRMHSAAADDGIGAHLPDAGPARYLGHLRTARERIVTHHDNPGLSAGDVRVLDAVLGLLDQVRSNWNHIESTAAGLPPTLVHGDFQTKNLRLRERDGRLELVPIDWEMAGWGSPVVDLADAPRPRMRNQVDLEAYHSAVAGRWPWLAPEDLTRLAGCGYLLRRLAAIEWETTHLHFTSPRYLSRPIATLRLYLKQVAEGLEPLGRWLR